MSPALLRQLVAFGLVGVAATATYYVTALGAHELLAAPLYVANLLGYACAVGVSFFGHAKFTFQTASSPEAFRRFIVVSVAMCLVSAALLAGVETYLSARGSLAVVVLVVPTLSFVLNKLWVYRPPVAPSITRKRQMARGEK